MIKLLTAIIGIIAFAGCTVMIPRQVTNAGENNQTQLQTREFQTREFDTNDTKLIMKAVFNVLQDDGFIIKNAVMDLGLLSATKEIDLQNTKAGDDFWMNFFEAMNRRSSNRNDNEFIKKFKVIEASINVSGIGKRTKVRANFQAKELDSKGNTLDVYTVEDAKYYQEFFSKVDKGVFIQKQGL